MTSLLDETDEHIANLGVEQPDIAGFVSGSEIRSDTLTIVVKEEIEDSYGNTAQPDPTRVQRDQLTLPPSQPAPRPRPPVRLRRPAIEYLRRLGQNSWMACVGSFETELFEAIDSVMQGDVRNAEDVKVTLSPITSAKFTKKPTNYPCIICPKYFYQKRYFLTKENLKRHYKCHFPVIFGEKCDKCGEYVTRVDHRHLHRASCNSIKSSSSSPPSAKKTKKPAQPDS